MSQVIVNLKIHNRSYKIKVSDKEESFVRETADAINRQIDEFQKKYRGRDIQDYLALTMIARMTESTKVTTADNVDENVLIDEIDKLTKLMS